MLQIQRERCRSACQFSPGLSLQGPPRDKFAYWLSRDFRENVGNKDTNALTVHRLDGMGGQGWKVRSLSVVQLLQSILCSHPWSLAAPTPPRASPWTNLVLRAARRDRWQGSPTARTQLRLPILLQILSCREHPYGRPKSKRPFAKVLVE